MSGSSKHTDKKTLKYVSNRVGEMSQRGDTHNIIYTIYTGDCTITYGPGGIPSLTYSSQPFLNVLLWDSLKSCPDWLGICSLVQAGLNLQSSCPSHSCKEDQRPAAALASLVRLVIHSEQWLDTRLLTLSLGSWLSATALSLEEWIKISGISAKREHRGVYVCDPQWKPLRISALGSTFWALNIIALWGKTSTQPDICKHSMSTQNQGNTCV